MKGFGALAIIAAGLFFVLVGATFSGTILWLIWPVIAPAFHLPSLGWWQAVCLVWTTHILLSTGGAKVSSNEK